MKRHIDIDSILRNRGLSATHAEKARATMQYIAEYHQHLSSLLSVVPELPALREKIANTPRPSLAIGPVELHICRDGFIALFKNSHGSELSLSLQISTNEPLHKVFDRVSKYTHTFVNPISQFVASGHSIKLGASFQCPPNILFTMIFNNLTRFDLMTPMCSKALVFGCDFATHPDEDHSALELARSHFRQAYYEANIGGKKESSKLLGKFRKLLDSETREHDLQKFLQHHPELLCPNFAEVRPKPTLAGERQPDFAISTQDYGGTRWLFVEIERPDKKIFTRHRNFQFTSELTQAEGQLLDWEIILNKDHSFFERRFPGLYIPQFLLVFGRDHELDEPRREKLRTKFGVGNKEFLTFDDLAQRFERIVSNFADAFRGEAG